MTTKESNSSSVAAKPHLHFKASQLDNDASLRANLKVFKKKTTIRAVQVACPFEVETLEGLMQGKALDWLAVGVNGEMYPIAADIFEKTYEPNSSSISVADAGLAKLKRIIEGKREALKEVKPRDIPSSYSIAGQIAALEWVLSIPTIVEASTQTQEGVRREIEAEIRELRWTQKEAEDDGESDAHVYGWKADGMERVLELLDKKATEGAK
jgi:hypothetical protein